MDHRVIILTLLVLLQGFPLAELQDTTVGPENGIPGLNMEDMLRHDGGNESNMVTNSEGASGAASGSMSISEGDTNAEEETTWEEKNMTTTHRPLMTTTVKNVNNSNSGRVDSTSTEDETSTPSVVHQNSTESGQNSTELNEDTTLTRRNASTHTELVNSTSPPNNPHSSTTSPPDVTNSTVSKPENNTRLQSNTSHGDPGVKPTAGATTLKSIVTALLTTPANTEPTTAGILKTSIHPKTSNLTDKNAVAGSSSEREDVDSKSKRNGAWGAVLGIGVAVAVVGLVAYAILKRRHQTGFSHRKLVEEFPSDPVLRLDNNQPLDLNFGGGAYYNPGLQGDHIQMSNFPENK